MQIKNKRGQIWIETILYTLIGIALIAIVLSFVIPKVNQGKDKSVVEQSIVSLNNFDDKIDSVLVSAGNRRTLEFSIRRGQFIVDPVEEQITFVLDDLNKPYSEVGTYIQFGKVNLTSYELTKTAGINMTIKYSDLDLRYNGTDDVTIFTPTSIPYKFIIEHKGINETTKERIIDINTRN